MQPRTCQALTKRYKNNLNLLVVQYTGNDIQHLFDEHDNTERGKRLRAMLAQRQREKDRRGTITSASKLGRKHFSSHPAFAHLPQAQLQTLERVLTKRVCAPNEMLVRIGLHLTLGVSRQASQTSEGTLSAVSRVMFASKYLFCSIFQKLQYYTCAHLCTVPNAVV